MRLIDADELIPKGAKVTNEVIAILVAITDAPTIDAVPVVRCKDCKHYNVYRLECHNGHMNGIIGIDGFCSYGEQKGG